MGSARTSTVAALALLLASGLAFPEDTWPPYPGPYRVKIINPTAAAFSKRLTSAGGKLYFVADDGIHGDELWVSDGTWVGTHMVKDIVLGPETGTPGSLTGGNPLLFFQADDGVIGAELWTSDGTEAGTILLKDINPSGDSYPSGSSGNLICDRMCNVGATLFFVADDGVHGRELWKTDGTEEGTVLVRDIYAGDDGSGAYYLTDVGGTLFFSARDGGGGSSLWKSDGTESGTVKVKDVMTSKITNVNGKVFFKGGDEATGWELWASDGTEEGTYLVKDIYPGPGWGSPIGLINVDGTLFFSAFDPAYGTELWKSDGTEEGTVMVKDIDPVGSSGAGRKIYVGGTLFVIAGDGVHGSELWKSDGTEEGTVMVKDINPAGDSDPELMIDVNGTLYFRAYHDEYGWELWTSDGTEEGTVMVTDLCPGTCTGVGWEIQAVGDLIFFPGGNENTQGGELWAYDTAPDPIPTVSQWGVVVTAIALLCCGSIIIARRERVTRG